MFTEFDSYLFHEGTLYDSYKKLGAHLCTEDGQSGVRFAVWAQNAQAVSVVIFDHTDTLILPYKAEGSVSIPMKKTQNGIWEVFVPGAVKWTCYKYLVDGADSSARWKADPYAFYSELRPASGSIVWGLDEYDWTDGEYLAKVRPGMCSETSEELKTAEFTALKDSIREDIIQGRIDEQIWLAKERIWQEKEKVKKEKEEEILKAREEKAAQIAATKEALKKAGGAGKDKVITEAIPASGTVISEGTKAKEADNTLSPIPGISLDPQAMEAARAAEEAKIIEEARAEAEAYANAVVPGEEAIDMEAIAAEARKEDIDEQALINRTAAELNRKRPMSIYEVHLGSWKKDYRKNKDGFLNYRELADQLADYVEYMGFTHVELMGICEYPFDGSWGYQVTGYFSASSRHGNPDDLKYFIDKMHSKGIGVIIDWVPAHFPKDAFGLEGFDGTAMYESPDPLLAEYPEWGTKAFDHASPEVRCFLISSAFYWIREFHADALRVDAVAAMLYTNFSRNPWRPNKYGGNQNLESIAFLKQLNEQVVTRTGAFLIAEDSSEEQGITKPVYRGGMGFMFKWNMGWMNDTIKYFKKDPIYRRYHFGALTHTMDYVFTEYFVNVLSHDEVVHLKKPMLYKLPGSIPDKLSGLKTLYTYQFTHPGKKLMFMGQEFAEDREWDENREINWYFANETWHRDVLECVRKLNAIYRTYPVLYVDTQNEKTVEWVNRSDAGRGILAYIRKNAGSYEGALLVIINTTPMQYNKYGCGVPKEGLYQRIFSTYDTTPGAGEISEETPALVPEKEMCDYYDYKLTYDLRPNESVIIKIG